MYIALAVPLHLMLFSYMHSKVSTLHTYKYQLTTYYYIYYQHGR